MPSTYSPNLRIELIANGEQSGTWGSTTNTNLGTLIEDAIAGYISVSITSADQALTANNGAADQSRNMVINLTTTTSANFNVYVPPVDKVYIIRNSSSYGATIYCSTVLGNTTAAGTGVTIPAGRETLVFSDATNVALGVDYLNSLVLGTALPVASGGTGQTSYTNGQLLIGNTTGNTLTKANLTGTANRVTVTNGTGSITLSGPQDIGTSSNVQFGSLGVGAAATGTAGEIVATNNVTAYYSDDRLKNRLGKIENALDKLCSLDGFYYEANEIAQALGYEAKREVGVSAQKMQEILPEIVAPAPIDNTYLTVRYERALPLIIEAIKELRVEIDALKKGS
jgi:hypothetical protein